MSDPITISAEEMRINELTALLAEDKYMAAAVVLSGLSITKFYELSEERRQQLRRLAKHAVYFGAHAPNAEPGTSIHEDSLRMVDFCKPVMDFLAKKYHPHMRVIITSTNIEVVEGNFMYNSDEFIK